MDAGADQSPASFGEEFVLRSGVRHGGKREFDFAVKAQAEISASIGRTLSSPPPKVSRFPRTPSLMMAGVVGTEENLGLEGFLSVPVAHVGHISAMPTGVDPGEGCSSGGAEASTISEMRASSSSTNKRLIRNIKELVKYVAGVREKFELHGRIHGGKILCLCNSCRGSKAIAACEFEKHAGSLKKTPADYIFMGNGRTIHDVLERCQTSTVDTVETTIRNAISPLPTVNNVCLRCKQSFNASHSQSSRAICGRCGDLSQSQTAQNSGISYPNAKLDDFNPSRCGPRIILLCDECGREYHLGCLKDHGMIDFEGIPKGKWFCTYRCKEVSLSLQRLIHQREMMLPDIAFSKLVMKNEEKRHLDIKWRLLSGRSTSADNKLLLDNVISIFHESFNPIVGARGRDLIPLLTKGSKGQDHRYHGIYCAVLIIGSSVVSAVTLQILRCEVAQLPLIATSGQNQSKGYFQALFHCIQSFLVSLHIKHLLLPAAKEAESMWIEKFGFIKRVPVENFMGMWMQNLVSQQFLHRFQSHFCL